MSLPLEKLRTSFLWQYDLVQSLYCILFFRTYNRWKKKFHSVKLNSVVCIEGIYGLADRLRGYISVYSICRKYGIPFKIHHFGTITLNQFIEPNSYDWFIGKEELKANDLSFEHINLQTFVRGCSAENFYMNRFLKKRLKNAHTNQILVNSNAFLVKDGKIFSQLFNELFRPTKIVQDQLDYYRKNIGGGGKLYQRIFSLCRTDRRF